LKAAKAGGGVATSQRVGELDALRGLAAFGVMVFHYTTQYGREIGHTPELAFGFPPGNYGVNLFFLISGYVIFMTLERTHTAADFVVSRFSRLYPAYWAAMLVTSCIVYTIGMSQQRIPASDWWLDVTMMQQILGGEHLDGSYWTLQVELFFYLIMLTLFMLGWLRAIRLVLVCWLSLSAVHAVSQLGHLHFSYTLREMLILRHIPYFALGILFYFRHMGRALSRVDTPLMIACIVIAWLSGGAVMLLVAVACTVIFVLFTKDRLAFLRTPILLWLGGLSYPLYLVHSAVGLAVMHALEARAIPPSAAISVAIGLALLLAILLHHMVELPALRMIRAAWYGRNEEHLSKTVP